MIHLSKFLIGARHKRIFRFNNLSGHLADDLIGILPSQYTKVRESTSNEGIWLLNDNESVYANFNRDDFIFDSRKLYDWDTREYVEINKKELRDVVIKCLPVAAKTMGLKDDYIRLGMIFEFRIPKWEGLDKKFGEFIFDNFVNFNTKHDTGQTSMRFVYKMRAPGGGAIKKEKGFRNVIVQIKEDKGLDEDGRETECFLISVDIQRIYEPREKEIDVEEEFTFAEGHIKTVLIPEFMKKGINITYE